MKERTWNKIILVILALVVGYFVIAESRADETYTSSIVEEYEFMISACTATYVLVSYYKPSYNEEAKRWAQFLIGFVDDDKERAQSLVERNLNIALERMQSGESSLESYEKLADKECVVLRDDILAFLDEPVSKWYGE